MIQDHQPKESWNSKGMLKLTAWMVILIVTAENSSRNFSKTVSYKIEFQDWGSNATKIPDWPRQFKQFLGTEIGKSTALTASDTWTAKNKYLITSIVKSTKAILKKKMKSPKMFQGHFSNPPWEFFQPLQILWKNQGFFPTHHGNVVKSCKIILQTWPLSKMTGK